MELVLPLYQVVPGWQALLRETGQLGALWERRGLFGSGRNPTTTTSTSGGGPRARTDGRWHKWPEPDRYAADDPGWLQRVAAARAAATAFEAMARAPDWLRRATVTAGDARDAGSALDPCAAGAKGALDGGGASRAPPAVAEVRKPTTTVAPSHQRGAAARPRVDVGSASRAGDAGASSAAPRRALRKPSARLMPEGQRADSEELAWAVSAV